MTIEQAIMEQVRVLSPEKQQDVLAFIAFLNTDEWEKTYQGRFQQLQQEVKIGVEAAERGEVIEAEVMFQQLREKLRWQKDQRGDRVKTNEERMALVEEMRQLFRETQALHADNPLTEEEIAAEIAAYRRGE